MLASVVMHTHNGTVTEAAAGGSLVQGQSVSKTNAKEKLECLEYFVKTFNGYKRHLFFNAL